MRKSSYLSVVFLLFLLSGFCSVVYQIVWLRLAFASFGIITPVLSVVVSVFMMGLALGSWLGGRNIARLTNATGWPAIIFYAGTELFIGLGGLIVPALFDLGQTLLLSSGDFNSASYLFLSAVVLSASILPWCICMGATIPFMMEFIRHSEQENTTGFGFLYLANVIGAMCGAIATAGFLIEWLGLHHTLRFAACFNLLIVIISLLLGLKGARSKEAFPAEQPPSLAPGNVLTAGRSTLVMPILFTTGFTSMAMEVVWTRAFTPVLQTSVYAFAAILAVYLFATWVGSRIYYGHAKSRKVEKVPSLVTLISFFCFIPVLFNDPRIMGLYGETVKSMLTLGSIFPFCAVLGYLTPKLIDEYSGGDPKAAGKAYAVNALGCILGPLTAGYFLLPAMGVRLALVVLAIPFTAYLFYDLRKKWNSDRRNVFAMALLILVFYTGATRVLLSYEDSVFYKNGEVRRDYVATVISCGEGLKKRLLVNGVGITDLTSITKFMAHMPLAIHNEKPKSILAICLGMGTTFRSGASWGIRSVAIELVPSVRDAFGFYFKDAAEILKNPNAKIIVDDGRRFLKRTQEKFDVITIDPPPPVYASGSGLLYSEEFYRIARTRLTEKGILQQWLPGGSKALVQAVSKSLANVFPYVRAFKSVEGTGFHFICSMQPFSMPSAEEFVGRLPEKAKADFLEWWPPGTDPRVLYQAVMERELFMPRLAPPDLKNSITDDRPFNEYYLMRDLCERT